MSSPFITREGGNVIDTTRSYPRSMRAAFPLDYRESAIGISGPPVIRLYTPFWLRPWQSVKQVHEFACVWWAYRKFHSWSYAARVAHDIAYKGASF